jgi:1,4-dihydroxy-6-naphthoate synthase
VAIPGEGTTATLLLRLFAPPGLERVVLRFDQIMPAITRGEVDAGLIIHESRFTHAQHGLEQLADLGALWEAQTGLPLPLGVIVADRSLPQPVVRSIEAGLRRSLERAWADPGRSRAYVREHAQEISEAVCRQHIELYVNAYSADLGDVGLAALTRLLDESRRIGMLPGSSLPLLATS